MSLIVLCECLISTCCEATNCNIAFNNIVALIQRSNRCRSLVCVSLTSLVLLVAKGLYDDAMRLLTAGTVSASKK